MEIIIIKGTSAEDIVESLRKALVEREISEDIFGEEEEECCGEDCCEEGCECGDCPDCEKEGCSCGCEDCECEGCDACLEYGGGSCECECDGCTGNDVGDCACGCDGCEEDCDDEEDECSCDCEKCSSDEDFELDLDIDLEDIEIAIESVRNAAFSLKAASELMAEGKRETMVAGEIEEAVGFIDDMADILIEEVEVDENNVEELVEAWKILAINFRDMILVAEEEGYMEVVVQALRDSDYKSVLEKIAGDDELSDSILEAEKVISDEDKDHLNDLVTL